MAELKPQQASRVLIFESHGSKHHRLASSHIPRLIREQIIARSLNEVFVFFIFRIRVVTQGRIKH